VHHFIYPAEDTYISNRSGYEDKNFGIDEILQIGTTNIPQRVYSATKDYPYTNAIFNNQQVTYFTAIFTGSFSGTVDFASGSISGSNLDFSASYFSGSIDGTPQELSASVVSGSLVDGYITGSISATYSTGLFEGTLSGSSGCLTGTGSGIDTRNEGNWTTRTVKYVDRAMLGFDLTVISQSIAEGVITDPKFYLKIKICNEYQLPINYTIFALAVSQSWNMGNGYWSDGGSDEGVSWLYRDNNDGTPWYNTYVSGTRGDIDFINTPSLATQSFGYGGGTWYTDMYSHQNFGYKSADIDMDVTAMVMRWISGSHPNNGFILISSDELVSTGSGFVLKFFSKDTNTIYSPVLDVCWNDSVYVTGSISTGSVTIATTGSGISASIQSGSSLTIAGGVAGIFSGSALLTLTSHYITESNPSFDSVIYRVEANVSGALDGRASYVSGSLSGSGIFTSSYFSGSVEGIDVEVSDTGISGSIIGILSGSIETTGSIYAYVGEVTASVIDFSGSFNGFYFDTASNWFYGFVVGQGLGGNILGLPVIGNVSGLVSVSESLVNGPCGKSFSASFASGSFLNGVWSGSTFGAFYVDHKFENAYLTGSWTEASLLGARVNIILPSAIEPYAYAYINGTYVWGNAIGLYTISGSNGSPDTASAGANSASFVGQLIDGPLLGAAVNLQLSGSVFTSSYQYTSSVEMSASVMTAMDISYPFSINLQNLQPQYRVGDVVRMNVFGRKKFPLKYFGKATQQEQYMIPEYLPSSSFYALKDDQTEEIVLNFDSYTQISCNYPHGNYFFVDTTALPQERYYRVLIRVQDEDEIYTIDTGKTFKIVRGGVEYPSSVTFFTWPLGIPYISASQTP